jgi:hypothetical protein
MCGIGTSDPWNNRGSVDNARSCTQGTVKITRFSDGTGVVVLYTVSWDAVRSMTPSSVSVSERTTGSWAEPFVTLLCKISDINNTFFLFCNTQTVFFFIK